MDRPTVKEGLEKMESWIVGFQISDHSTKYLSTLSMEQTNLILMMAQEISLR